MSDLLRRLLPKPVREEALKDGVLLAGGDPGLVAVRVSKRGLTVFIYRVRWSGPCTPVADHRKLCQLAWQELPEEQKQLEAAVRGLIRAAVVIRRAGFITCKFCRKTTPPEWRIDGQICQSCAENYLGVTF